MEGFKRREPKKKLSEAEIDKKAEEFAAKADGGESLIENKTDNQSDEKDHSELFSGAKTTKSKIKKIPDEWRKNATRNIRYTIRMNKYEMKQLEELMVLLNENKLDSIRIAIKEERKRQMVAALKK